jgi:hypothetical protein
VIRIAPALLLLGACLPPFRMLRPQYDAVKHVAIAQFAIYQGPLGGVAGTPEARWEAAARHADKLARAMSDTWRVVPLAKMESHPAYAKSRLQFEGWFTAKGMRFFADPMEDYYEQPPPPVRQLCKDLGVDGVLIVTEAWNFGGKSGPFVQRRAIVTGPVLTFHMFNLLSCDGRVVWSDFADGESTDSLEVEGLNVTATPAAWAAATDQSFDRALAQIRARLKQ